MELYKALCEISGEGNVLKDEPMKMHTTFRIGGPADYFIQPSKIEEIRRIVAVCRECSTPYYIMGNGSNLLVGDKGFRGVIVQVFKQMSDVYADGERVYAQAGALLSKTAAVACEASLTGMEFIGHSGNARRRASYECGSIRRRDETDRRKCGSAYV